MYEGLLLNHKCTYRISGTPITKSAGYTEYIRPLLWFIYQSIKILTTPILRLMVPNNVFDRFVLKNMLDVLCYLRSLIVTLTSLHSF